MLSSPQPADDAKPRRPRLPVIALLLWAVFALVIPRFVQSLNVADVLAFPLGFFMMAQGALIAFVAIAVVSARRRDRLEAGEER